MTHNSDPTSTKHNLPSAESRWRKALLVFAVFGACCVAYNLGGLWAEWRSVGKTPPPSTALPTAASLNPLASVLPLSGPWSFGDLDWNLKAGTIKANEISVRFETIAQAGAAAKLGELPDVSPELTEIATLLHLAPESRNGYELYRLDRPDLKAILVSRNVEGQAKAVAVACALPQAGDDWQLFELTPRGAGTKIDPDTAHLLPLPSSAVRRGGRFADDGRLLLELVTLTSNSDDLLAAWRAAGWEIRESGMGAPGCFSFLCHRGEDVIYAWSANAGESLENLMLVRSPTDAELQAQHLIPKE